LSISLASSRQLSIDGQPALGTSQRVVPLAVGVPAAGVYTLQASQLLNLSTVPVYLRDLQTGALVDLAQQPSYQFSVSNASALLTGRFELVFSPQQVLATAPAALAQQVALYPNPAKTSAWLELPASLGRQALTATLLDAVGRPVRTITLPAQGVVAHQLDLHQLATGIYALRLSTSAGVVVKRLVVE
ncbi:MAG: T9SS type A sorting domain-containing protein, partial [Hymenobacter sp.]